MNCFNHPDKSAVGFCKSCCKGLCPDCAAEVENGLACRNACEDRVSLINRIIDHNEKIIGSANAQMRSSALLALIFGVLICAYGFLTLRTEEDAFNWFLVAMGLVFVIYGVLRLSKKRLYPTAK